MTITEKLPDNGVNVDALLGAREAMTEMPAAAAFTWRAGSEWVNGTHARTTVEKFFGLGEEQSHREAFVVDTDHPELFASRDQLPDATLVATGIGRTWGSGAARVEGPVAALVAWLTRSRTDGLTGDVPELPAWL